MKLNATPVGTQLLLDTKNLLKSFEPEDEFLYQYVEDWVTLHNEVMNLRNQLGISSCIIYGEYRNQ